MEPTPTVQVRRVLRSPSMKRKTKAVPPSERVVLEKVLGLTGVNGAASLATDSNTGTIAYPAGCVVVLYNTRKFKQSHIFNQSKKTVTCVAFSADGKNLVTGESGHQPAVRVWDVDEKTQIAQFNGHKFGINCVAFSPNLKYIASVGTQHDMTISIWNWKTNTKVASNKVASKVVDVSFSENGSTIITVGIRHVKFWYLDAAKSRIKETVPLLGRSGILGEQKNNVFSGVVTGRGALASRTYCTTRAGLLCEFNEKRLLDKWVQLRTSAAYSLALGDKHLFVGCADGVVRVFSVHTLSYVTTLPKPHHLGVDVATGRDTSHLVPDADNVRFPDTLAVSLDRENDRLSCVYSDHSLYIWDVHNTSKIGKSRSFLFHSACVWGLEMYPALSDGTGVLPAGSFITCGSDDTIRVWNCEPHMSEGTAYRRNLYSNELLKVIYIDPELNNITSTTTNRTKGQADKSDTVEKNGVRSLRVSPDGQHLASGDRLGNIRVHDLQHMEQKYCLEAHDSEVLCLEYTKPSMGVRLLSSASRDRLLHVFDVDQAYGLVQTLDDHSAAITAVKFCGGDAGHQVHMLSCGADKSLLFRTAQMEPQFQFVLNRHLVSKTTMYDMVVDPTGKFVVIACQDRNVRIYNIESGKQKRCYSGATGSEGALIQVALDASGAYLATSCSDKQLALFDFYSGELLASMSGHSEVVTGVRFSHDGRRLISVSADGCIFIWRLPAKFKELPEDRDTVVDGRTPVVRPVVVQEPQSDYRLSVSQMPSWAKKQVLQEPFTKTGGVVAGGIPVVSGPQGRWAENTNVAMKSMLDASRTLNVSLDRRRFSIEPETPDDWQRIIKHENCQQVPIINDDEFNQDNEEVDDGFSWLSREDAEKCLRSCSPPFAGPGQGSYSHITRRRRADTELADLNESDDGDDEEEDAVKDIIYYPVKQDIDSPVNASNSFMVCEGEKSDRDSRVSLTSVDTNNDFSDEETDSSSVSPTTPSDHNKNFIDENVPDEKFMQNNFENLAAENFAESSDILDNEICDLRMFPSARLSFSRRFLSRSTVAALRKYPLKRNDQDESRGRDHSTPSELAGEPDDEASVTKAASRPSGWDVAGRTTVNREFPHEKSPPTRLPNHTTEPMKVDAPTVANSKSKALPSAPTLASQAPAGPTPVAGGPQKRSLVEPSKIASLAGERRRWPAGGRDGASSRLSPPPASPLSPPPSSPSSPKWPAAPRSQPPSPSSSGKRAEGGAARPLRSPAAPCAANSSPFGYYYGQRAASLSPAPHDGAAVSRSATLPRQARRKSLKDPPPPVAPAGGGLGKTTSIMRTPAYSKATESSSAKTSADTSSVTNVTTVSAPTKKAGAVRRSRLSEGQKGRFKSTPNLVTVALSELPSGATVKTTAKTTEDLQVTTTAEAKGGKPAAGATRKSGASRRSMQPPQTTGVALATTGVALATASAEDVDRHAMPPPVTPATSDGKGARPELTLTQAKDILRSKPSAGGRGVATASPPSAPPRGVRGRGGGGSPPSGSQQAGRWDVSPVEPPVKDDWAADRCGSPSSSDSERQAGGRARWPDGGAPRSDAYTATRLAEVDRRTDRQLDRRPSSQSELDHFYASLLRRKGSGAGNGGVAGGVAGSVAGGVAKPTRTVRREGDSSMLDLRLTSAAKSAASSSSALDTDSERASPAESPVHDADRPAMLVVSPPPLPTSQQPDRHAEVVPARRSSLPVSDQILTTAARTVKPSSDISSKVDRHSPRFGDCRSPEPRVPPSVEHCSTASVERRFSPVAEERSPSAASPRSAACAEQQPHSPGRYRSSPSHSASPSPSPSPILSPRTSHHRPQSLVSPYRQATGSARQRSAVGSISPVSTEHSTSTEHTASPRHASPTEHTTKRISSTQSAAPTAHAAPTHHATSPEHVASAAHRGSVPSVPHGSHPSVKRRSPPSVTPSGERPQARSPSSPSPLPPSTLNIGQQKADQHVQLPTCQVLTGQQPTGQQPTGHLPTGQQPTSQQPTGQPPTGLQPTGQQPTSQQSTSQQPTGQQPSGQQPTDQQLTGQQPTGQQPTGQQPTDQQPTSEQLTGQQPTGQQPTGQQPTGQQPTGQQPTGQQLTGQQPTGQQPTGQQPTGQQPTGQQPTGQQHTGQQPTGQQPTGQQPTGQQHTGQQPTGQQPTGQQPTGQQPTGQQHTGQQPTGQQPTGQQPTGQQPTGQQPTGQQPTGQQPTGQQHTGHQPNDQQPTGQQPTGQQPTSQQHTGHQPNDQQPTGQQQSGRRSRATADRSNHTTVPTTTSPNELTSPRPGHQVSRGRQVKETVSAVACITTGKATVSQLKQTTHDVCDLLVKASSRAVDSDSLRSAMRDARDRLDSALGEPSPGTTALLERYSEQLSERVCSMISRRLQQQSAQTSYL